MSTAQGSGSGKGKFFSIDRQNWAALCDLGDMNAAASYLLLAQGTCGNNTTTSWSVESVKKYLGVGWKRAQESIAKLEECRFIQPSESATKPRRKILAPSERIILHASRKLPKLPDGDSGNIWLPNAIVGSGTLQRNRNHRSAGSRSAGDLWALRLFVDLYHSHNLRDDGGISRS